MSGRKGLGPGTHVRVVPVASPVHDRDVIRAGVARLAALGVEVSLDPRVGVARGYLAGDDRARALALEEAFADPTVDVVLALGGGYGSQRLLDHLDLSLLDRHAKPFVGFSDVTALHLALVRHTRVPAFHGPMLNTLARATPYTLTSLHAALTGVGGPVPASEPDLVETLVPGEARGPLTGGCLSLVVASLGTPWSVVGEGAVLFLEDVDEEPYRIDRMLTQLRQAGVLAAAAGIVIGECVDCRPADFRPAFPYGSLTLGEILADVVAPLGVPTLVGLPIGHGVHQATLPYGASATITGGRLVLDGAP